MKSAITLTLVFVLLVISAPAFGTAVPFAEQATLTLSADEPRSIAFGDIDGDGDDDIVSASVGDLKLAWYPNDGDETYGSEVVVASGSTHQLQALSNAAQRHTLLQQSQYRPCRDKVRKIKALRLSLRGTRTYEFRTFPIPQARGRHT